MDLKQISEVCKNTVTLRVMDVRGLPVREVQCNRRTAGETMTLMVTHRSYDAGGHLATLSDPRRFAARQSNPQLTANALFHHDFAGQLLAENNLDNGRKLSMWGRGQSVQLQWSGEALEHRLRYAYDRAQRPLACYETAQKDTQQEQVTERWLYGENQADAVDHNLNGRCIRHYDSGGVQHYTNYSVRGEVLVEMRQLTLEDERQPDWQGETEEEWLAQLEDTRYVTRYGYNALNELFDMTDAAGNRRSMVIDALGQPVRQAFTPVGGQDQVIRDAADYNAFGQVIQEQFGNGVYAEYRYVGETGQLHTAITRRAAQPGRSSLLQELYYQRDPIGNVIDIHNYALEDRFFQNTKIAAVARYRYDACYQMLEVESRESAAVASPVVPIINDPEALRLYNRQYQYDLAGNIEAYRHSTTHTQRFFISNDSNRSLPAVEGFTEDVERFFDGSGNLLQDHAGRQFSWDQRNRLQRVTLLARVDGDDDRESYQYSGSGMRLRKTTRRLTRDDDRSVSKKEEAIYLPGLTLRRVWHGTILAQSWEDVRCGLGTHVQLNYLHWQTAKRALPDQWRYSLQDQSGAHQLTVDETGDIINFAEFMPFGETAVWSARSESEAACYYYRYSGKELDGTGLYYYGYRYYAPWANRWVNPDPAGFIDGINLYLMVGNNPVTQADQAGLVGFKPYISGAYVGKEGKSSFGGKQAVSVNEAVNPSVRYSPRSAGRLSTGIQSLTAAVGRGYQRLATVMRGGYQSLNETSPQTRPFALMSRTMKDTSQPNFDLESEEVNRQFQVDVGRANYVINGKRLTGSTEDRLASFNQIVPNVHYRKLITAFAVQTELADPLRGFIEETGLMYYPDASSDNNYFAGTRYKVETSASGVTINYTNAHSIAGYQNLEDGVQVPYEGFDLYQEITFTRFYSLGEDGNAAHMAYIKDPKLTIGLLFTLAWLTALEYQRQRRGLRS